MPVAPSINSPDPTIQRSIERSLAQQNAPVLRTGKPVLDTIGQMIRSARYNFEPVVGKIYHLHRDSTGYILSEIKMENHAGIQYIGSYRFSVAGVWEKI